MEESMKMVRTAYQALEEKKGQDIRVLDISKISVLADYFIITNGTSDSQVNALVDNVDEKMHKAGYSLKQQEGHGGASWILMDYGGVIVHIFYPEARSYYDLEHLWADAQPVDLSGLLEEEAAEE